MEGDDPRAALDDLNFALKSLLQSLSISRERGQTAFLPMIFDRLGEVFLELHYLETRSRDSEFQSEFSSFLDKEIGKLEFQEERIWQVRLRQPELAFSKLNTLGKAQRLFEIAVFQADESSEFHQMFDSLTQAAQVAQLRGQDLDLQYFGTLANTIRGLDAPQQETLFLGFLQLLEAHLLFRSDPDSAIEEYKYAARDIVQGGSFGNYLMQRQFSTIQTNLGTLEKGVAQRYCDELKKAWAGQEMLQEFAIDLELLIIAAQ